MDARPERVKAMRDKSFPKCKNPHCKFRCPPHAEDYAKQGYCTLGCMLVHFERGGLETVSNND